VSRDPDVDAAQVDSSGWFAVEMRYGYLVAEATEPYLVEDRVILVDAPDEEAALGRAMELAPNYEDEFETDAGEAGTIRYQGIVTIKELDDPPATGTEVWHEFMSPASAQTDGDAEALPPVWPPEMAFPRGHDD
jgi:hypothetical protein